MITVARGSSKPGASGQHRHGAPLFKGYMKSNYKSLSEIKHARLLISLFGEDPHYVHYINDKKSCTIIVTELLKMFFKRIILLTRWEINFLNSILKMNYNFISFKQYDIVNLIFDRKMEEMQGDEEY